MNHLHNHTSRPEFRKGVLTYSCQTDAGSQRSKPSTTKQAQRQFTRLPMFLITRNDLFTIESLLILGDGSMKLSRFLWKCICCRETRTVSAISWIGLINLRLPWMPITLCIRLQCSSATYQIFQI